MEPTSTAVPELDALVTARPGPLSGLLVADFSRVLAGPYATMLLGDMGATVVKVESPAGDDTRTWRPPDRGAEATYYLAINRNKRSVTLDLKDPDDAEVARGLAAAADIMVQNFRPGTLERWGLDYEAVAEANPGIVYASISAFGSSAGRSLPGYDILVQASSGLMSITGRPDTEPLRTGVSIADVVTGLHTAVGILAALRHRELTGEGQHVELDLLSSMLSSMVNQASAYVAGGQVPQRLGNEHQSVYPYGPMATGDGVLIVAAANNGQFVKLCDGLGIPAVARDPRFANPELRSHNRGHLRPLLEEALAARPAAQWEAMLNAIGVPCAQINDIRGGVEFAERLGLTPVVEAGGVPTVRNPVSFSHTGVDYPLAPPALGGDADLIRRLFGRA